MSQCNQLLCKVIESPKNFAANGDHNIQSIKILVGRNGWLIGDTKRSYHPAAGNQYILSCHYGLLHILRSHSDPCLTTCSILFGGISGVTSLLAGAASVDRTPHERRSNCNNTVRNRLFCTFPLRACSCSNCSIIPISLFPNAKSILKHFEIDSPNSLFCKLYITL